MSVKFEIFISFVPDWQTDGQLKKKIYVHDVVPTSWITNSHNRIEDFECFKGFLSNPKARVIYTQNLQAFTKGSTLQAVPPKYGISAYKMVCLICMVFNYMSTVFLLIMTTKFYKNQFYSRYLSKLQWTCFLFQRPRPWKMN